ncbi:MAG: alpha/beta fold hydrolase [bacterium]|nr:alpha/beta fold hydrolase [bacterium]
MNLLSNFVLEHLHKKPILLDVFYNANKQKKPLLIFAHGFKGFKDWGHFNALGAHLATKDLVFVKFNFSHNGTTVQHPDSFEDLEAFGNNNYTLELDDLKRVMDWALLEAPLQEEIDHERLYLLGHSRGGGICIIKAAEDPRVKKLVTWASVCDFLNRNKKKTIETWQRDGVVYATNARTKQKMPLYYQFFEDQQNNKERFHIVRAAKSLTIPFLIIHGTADEAVEVAEAQHLHQAAKLSELFLVEGAGHTFDVKHPFQESNFPAHAQRVIDKTIEFLKE